MSGETTLEDDIFNPLETELGFIVLAYTENDIACPIYEEVTIRGS